MTHRNARYEDKKESEKTGKGNPEKLHKKWADLSRAAEGEEKLLKGETDRVNDVRVIFYHNTMRKTLDRMEVVSFQQFKPRREKRKIERKSVCGCGCGCGCRCGCGCIRRSRTPKETIHCGLYTCSDASWGEGKECCKRALPSAHVIWCAMRGARCAAHGVHWTIVVGLPFQ